jgi:SNF2 family DNA or RNA helicase
MAGLYAKELMLRGDAERILIVAPASLVEQWQEELADKFGLRFELLTRQLADATIDGCRRHGSRSRNPCHRGRDKRASWRASS